MGAPPTAKDPAHPTWREVVRLNRYLRATTPATRADADRVALEILAGVLALLVVGLVLGWVWMHSHCITWPSGTECP